MKRVTLTDEQRMALQVIISMEIKDSIASKSLGIKPVFSIKELKVLYKKISGREWEE